MSEYKRYRQNRALWFRIYKWFTRLKYRRPQFIYLGGKPDTNSIIISNHEGTYSPLTLENFAEFPLRFWGTWEMNAGLKTTYKYLSEIYYHKKHHWSIKKAKIFSLIAAPFTTLFYKGLNLISTYHDASLMKTMHESLDALKSGNNIVIFPEQSENGYFDVLQGFYAGFLLLAKICFKNGIDVKIFPAYYKRKQHVYIFDKPVKYSDLLAENKTRDEMLQFFLDRCNSLRNFDNVQ